MGLGGNLCSVSASNHVKLRSDTLLYWDIQGKGQVAAWQGSYSDYKAHMLFSSALAIHVLLWKISEKDSVWLTCLLPSGHLFVEQYQRRLWGGLQKTRQGKG